VAVDAEWDIMRRTIGDRGLEMECDVRAVLVWGEVEQVVEIDSE
jgi:hypothetical protein